MCDPSNTDEFVVIPPTGSKFSGRKIWLLDMINNHEHKWSWKENDIIGYQKVNVSKDQFGISKTTFKIVFDKPKMFWQLKAFICDKCHLKAYMRKMPKNDEVKIIESNDVN